MRHENFMLNVNDLKRINLHYALLVLTATVILLSSLLSVSAQSNPNSTQIKDSDNKADSNLKSAARVNPTTLAMELGVPMMSYPGRNGNSMSFGLSYSSKLWRMDDRFTYWYQLPYSCNKQYVTQLNAKFAERSISGWSSSIAPPIIEERTDFYNQNGKPVGNEFDEVILNGFYESLTRNYESLLSDLISRPDLPCGWICARWDFNLGGCTRFEWNSWCDVEPCLPGQACYPGGGGDSGCPHSGQPAPRPTYYVKRVNVRTSDGATHEFRKSDARFGYCFGSGDWRNGPDCENTNPDNEGVFLSVDGSGMRLERDADTGSTLFMPDGSRYEFPAGAYHLGEERKLFFATEYADSDGNITSFSESIVDNQVYLKQTDTMGREITDPLPQNFGSAAQAVKEEEVKPRTINSFGSRSSLTAARAAPTRTAETAMERWKTRRKDFITTLTKDVWGVSKKQFPTVRAKLCFLCTVGDLEAAVRFISRQMRTATQSLPLTVLTPWFSPELFCRTKRVTHSNITSGAKLRRLFTRPAVTKNSSMDGFIHCPASVLWHTSRPIAG
jgi:hypothetical protein